MYVVVNIKKLW